jgi:hypothetical protein
MARLIVQIRKEAAKREAEEAFAQAVEVASLTVRSFDVTRPRLPSIPFSSRAQSHTSRGVFYEIDLSGPACTCPDFLSYRYRLPTGHLTRCCKHIFTTYAQVKPVGGWPSWLGAFMRLAWTPHPQKEWLVVNNRPGWFVFQARPNLVLISSPPNGWADVFAPDDGQYDRYGYNVAEDRWAYNIQPRDADRIQKRSPLSRKGGKDKWPFSIATYKQ